MWAFELAEYGMHWGWGKLTRESARVPTFWRLCTFKDGCPALSAFVGAPMMGKFLKNLQRCLEREGERKVWFLIIFSAFIPQAMLAGELVYT
jgi:hypothetical protein